MVDNRKRLFVASFMTLIVAGLFFGLRASILGDWATQFGFTKSELGAITGGGFVGFGLVILAASALAEKLGYAKLMWVAFVLHILSAVVTIAATPVYGDGSAGNDAAYWMLYVGMFMFAVAWGTCEAIINPLTATLYPEEKTHYLNILHAGWPGGLILGGLIAFFFASSDARLIQVRWEFLVALFLIPTFVYGYMLFGQKFPLSEARAAGVTYLNMLKEFAAPVLLFLLFLHACVGYVELGTDSWIINIMQYLIAGDAFLLFIYTSSIMFVLRFFAGPIVHRINPLGLLFVSAVLATIGLFMLGSVATGVAIIIAGTIYGIGKTFFWPTMLAVVSERFPRGGALTLGAIGGIGMLSAGLLGGPGIGYTQDHFAAEFLHENHPAVHEKYVSDSKQGFLLFREIAGLDGAKVGALLEKNPDELSAAEVEERAVLEEASIRGGQSAFRWTALVPLTMALGFLLLIFYFRALGGYKAIQLEKEDEATPY
ncbi:MAG: MFS transporter [Gammaproteobacteria bacterium]|nr:MFS transporter [Gammaproteobacteria bacterium]MDH5320949.1 MFS transporter [Gammaproteobacteria bacterium]